jgi:hypothetical protein
LVLSEHFEKNLLTGFFRLRRIFEQQAAQVLNLWGMHLVQALER